ncbi:Uncharacterised protein [Starkeya nomas]|uniref:DUF2946 domain-containing protein n=1 Tax=Starkeya nomas TaxID=2666134 RepID=A0A5S9P1W1_9HYPH|nr:hypothetical protein [Starkeya nomas]CAA0097214.1 Uncharacterised protein [Starkeya nomas]
MQPEHRHPGGRTSATTLRQMALALAVAYLVVLQTLLGGLASGAHAASGVALDAFGQVLCVGAHNAPSSPDEPAHHTPDCCTTGCQMSAGAGLPPPASISLAAPSAAVLLRKVVPRSAAVALGVERSPRHTRAPPLA